MFGATMSVGEFYRAFWRRENGPEAWIKTPKGMELAFAESMTDGASRP